MHTFAHSIVLVMLVAAVGGMILLLINIARSAPKRDEMTRLKVLGEQLQLQVEELRGTAHIVDDLRMRNVRLEADLENERKGAQEKLKVFLDAEARLKTEFENLANRIFEEKGKTFTEQNKEKLGGLLLPMREQLESFRKRIDDVHKDDTAGMAKLLEQVRQLQQLNNKVSEDANNLARAIKGDSKTQGNWGELIVERIFEASGLECGREYERQAGIRTEDGILQKPDFIVNLPGNKSVIVDSKVSLTAYERFCGEQDEKEKQAALTEHILSIRKHIEELRQKAYQQLLGNRTLDFVIMCVPVEPAYQLAHQRDRELIYDLAAGNVVVTGPSTLMLTLKLIAQMWRREKENRNAEVIADRASRLYDQVVLVVEAMLDAQKKLDGVRDSFDSAMKRLKDGRGNVVGRIEEIRKLGLKANRLLSQDIIDVAVGQAEQNDADTKSMD